MPEPGLLGKLAPKHDRRTLQLRDYLPPTLPAPPAEKAWDAGVRAWGMMRNDAVGDCTCAAVGHAIQLTTVNASSEVTISDAAVIAAYTAVSGYDPRTGANDNGAFEMDVLNLWRKTGVGGHACTAFAQCSLIDQGDIEACIALLGFCYIGFSVPASAMQQFRDGQPWDVVQNDGGIEGGHAVICVDYDADGLTVITWGQLQRMTWAFWHKYVDEAYGVVTPEWIAASGQSPSGLNLQQLLTDVQQLTQQPDPTPTPEPTPPPFVPDPNVVAWTARQQTVAAGVASLYAEGNVDDARVWQADVANYAASIGSMLAGHKTRKLVEPPPQAPK